MSRMSAPDGDGEKGGRLDTSFADRVRELQQQVEELARITGRHPVQPAAGVPANARELVRSILRFRGRRRAIFGEILSGEPAWDMLLELYEAELAGRRESVSSLCIASAAPATTALRWIRLLEKQDWIRRVADPRDGRRFFVELTGAGRDAMSSVFCALSLPPPL